MEERKGKRKGNVKKEANKSITETKITNKI